MNLDFYQQLRSELTNLSAELIAVSKTKPAADIQTLYDQGQRLFGENKVQELCDKAAQLPKDIDWHMIGHLQRNKVKYIAPFVHLIHGVDSERLLKEVEKQAIKHGRKLSCLLQIHIAEEETKFGFSEQEAIELTNRWASESHEMVEIQGLMGMASNTSDTEKVSAEFASLKALFQRLKASAFVDQKSFCQLSMGMSSDYPLALANGSTLIRVGSKIFGSRG